MSGNRGGRRSPLLLNSVCVVGLEYKDSCASSRHPGKTGDFRVTGGAPRPQGPRITHGSPRLDRPPSARSFSPVQSALCRLHKGAWTFSVFLYVLEKGKQHEDNLSLED